jgi:integrase
VQIVRKRKNKSAHGTVTVHSSRGRLRVVFTHKGERRYLYLGIPDTVPARGLAELIARRIETDIYADKLDESLDSYRPEKVKRIGMTVYELFEAFIRSKEAEQLTKTTIGRYRALMKWIDKSSLATLKADAVGDSQAINFERRLDKGGLGSQQRRRRVEEMRACWEWASLEGLLSTAAGNPWNKVRKTIKVAPRQRPKPFTQTEVGVIIQGFKANNPHYADFVEFLFLTGCRTSEACGLRWKHLNDECDRVWIGEMLVRGVQRPAKGLKARTVHLSGRVQELLLSRRPARFNPDGLIFKAAEGGPIVDCDFTRRHWGPMLKKLGIPHRRFYLTRSSFVSHCLANGMPASDVAKLTGHSVKTLLECYAGDTQNHVKLPDIFLRG